MLLDPQDKLLFIGDSVTDVGRARPVGYGYGDGLGHGYPLLVNAMLGVRYPDLDFEVLNVGTSGDTTRHLVDRWQTDVLDIKPDVLSILIGINDVWRHFDNPGRREQVSLDDYRKNLEALLEETLPTVKSILLLTPFFMELHTDDPMREACDRHAEVCRELAAKYDGVRLVDTQAAFDRLLQKRHYMTIASDRVHPNTIGHLLIAEEVMAALEA